MATIQIKRRTTAGTGPLTGTTGTVKIGEPLVDFNGGHLYIAKADKVANSTVPLSTSDYLAIPSVEKVNDQIDTKMSALGTAATKNTGTTSGCVPVLDSNGKLVDAIIPRIALTNTFVVASEAAMLALSTAQEGDVAIRTDLNKSFILKTTGYSSLANWQELLTPTDLVQSVNGKTGTVSITLTDLGGVLASTYNTHLSSNVHLTTNQINQLASMKMFDMVAETGSKSLDNIVTWEESVILEGLTVFFNDYGTGKTAYLGIDKTKVLQPNSTIDGGTY